MLGLRYRLLVLLLLVVAPARAEPVPGGEVHVERSDRAFDCPNEAELVKSTLALGTAPAAPGTASISIAVRFDRTPSSYVANVSASGQKAGERELRADDADCARLADSVAVVLAVLLDLVPPAASASFEPLASTETAPNPPAPKPAPSLQPAAPTPAPSAAPARNEPGAAVVTSLRAEGALAYGLLGPGFSPYVGGALSVVSGPFALALGGDWVAPRDEAFDRIKNTRVHVGLAYGFVDGCFHPGAGTARGWDAAACGRFAAGVFSGDGRGFDHHFPQQKAWFAAGPLGAVRYRLTPELALRFDALVLVALGHQTLLVSGEGAAFKSLPLAAALGFGPELTIW